MPSSPAAVRRADAVVDRLSPAFARSLVEAVRAARGRIPRQRLQQLIAAGRLGEASELALEVWQRQGEAWQREVSVQMRSALEIGGNNAADDFNRRPPTRVEVRIAFDVTNPRATEWARAESARLVTDVTRHTREAVREVIGRAFTDQLTSQQTARSMREVIGLTARDEAAARNFREQLRQMQTLPTGTARDTVLRRLSSRGLTDARVEDLVGRYRDRLLNRRSKLISRTEIQSAQNEGQLELWRQAQDDGLLPANARKRWLVTRDTRLCPWCSPLEGVEVSLNGTFDTQLGPAQRPPLHPACRCTVSVVSPISSRRRAA